jgi:molybdenum-dependent DNA-binding transcriptional regulator ModE
LLEREVARCGSVNEAAKAMGMSRAFAYRLLQQKKAGER